jgi:hypothetical protein
MKKNLLFFFSITIIATSCKEKNEDITHEINKNGAVETSVTIEHINDSSDVLITKHIVWIKNIAYKTIYSHDTIPALGMENTNAENSDGDKKQVSVKKDYEIFITVK